MTGAAVEEQVERLLFMGQAYGLCARLLAPPRPLPPPPAVRRGLREALARLGLREALAALERLEKACRRERGALPGEFTRLFLQNRVPPYETSYLPKGSTGHVRQLADIAGFYRAFGFRVQGEKPDHLGAELEFMALLCIKEAHARLAGRQKGAETCAQARRMFWQEHLGTWLGPYRRRLEEEARHPAFPALASLVWAVVMGQ